MPHAQPGEIHPGINICRIFHSAANHLVTRVPIQAIGDKREAFAGIFDEGDFVRTGVNQFGRQSAYDLSFGIPLPSQVSIVARFGNIFFERDGGAI